MKTRRTVYITTGIFLIVLNIFVDIVNPDGGNDFSNPNFSIGYFMGSHFFVIVGLVLLRLAYKVNQKIKNKELSHLGRSIGDIGKSDL